MTTKDIHDKILTYSQYEYDSNGNITKEKTKEKEKTYTYDGLNRIKTVSNGTSYTYDKAGNIQTKTEADGKVTAYNYNAKNQLTKIVTQKDLEVIGQKTYEYDENGNQIKEQENEKIIRYIFNEKNELEEVKENEETKEKYKYDEEGKRVQRQKGTEIRKYVYDGEKVIQELNKKDEERAKNTYGLSLIKRKANCEILPGIAEPDPDVPVEPEIPVEPDESNITSEEIINNIEGQSIEGIETEDTSGEGIDEGDTGGNVVPDDIDDGACEAINIEAGYYLYNGHGDVVSIVNKENRELNAYEYDEYGQVEKEEENLENVYKYAGYIQDNSTKNYYLNARYYNPAIQRFISEDTVRGKLEDPLSLNLYTYTHNNPLIYTDPDGHSIIGATLLAGLAGSLINTGIHFIGDILDDGKINSGWKSYVGAAVEGAITGVGFGAVGANASVLLKGASTFVAGVVGRTANDYISTKEINIKESLISGATSAIAAATFGIGGKVPEGIARADKYLTYFFKGYNAGVSGNLVNQVLTKGRNVNITEVGLSGFIGGTVSSLGAKVADVIGDLSGKLNRKNIEYKEFESFNQLKKYLGKAGENKEWHHIVEQSQMKMSSFTKNQIHNTKNIVAIDKKIHRMISGYYSSKQDFTGNKTVRKWLSNQSYEDQCKFGIEKLREFGVKI